MKFLKIAIITFLFTASIYIGNELNVAGVFRSIAPFSKFQCEPVDGLTGAEDVAFSKAHGKFLISTNIHRVTDKDPAIPGALYDFQPGSQPRKLSENLGFDIFPHGISIWEGKETRLFVINHRLQGTTVEIFLYDGNSLKHEKTINDERVLGANDLVAVDVDKFYLTRDHETESRQENKFADFARLAKGSVVFYDGNIIQSAIDKVAYANGITVSNDGKYIFVSEMLRRRVRVYERISDNQLKFIHDIDLKSSPDNLSIDSNGALWIGSHPKLLTLIRHGKVHSRKAPSLVIKVTDPLSPTEISEEFLDDGTKISGLSVAQPGDGKLFLGTIWDHRHLICTL